MNVINASAALVALSVKVDISGIAPLYIIRLEVPAVLFPEIIDAAVLVDATKKGRVLLITKLFVRNVDKNSCDIYTFYDKVKLKEIATAWPLVGVNVFTVRHFPEPDNPIESDITHPLLARVIGIIKNHEIVPAAVVLAVVEPPVIEIVLPTRVYTRLLNCTICPVGITALLIGWVGRKRYCVRIYSNKCITIGCKRALGTGAE